MVYRRSCSCRRWRLKQTVLNWWKWCMHRRNCQLSRLLYKKSNDIRHSFLNFYSNIFQEKLIQWLTILQEVLGFLFQLFTMLVFLLQFRFFRISIFYKLGFYLFFIVVKKLGFWLNFIEWFSKRNAKLCWIKSNLQC